MKHTWLFGTDISNVYALVVLMTGRKLLHSGYLFSNTILQSVDYIGIFDCRLLVSLVVFLQWPTVESSGENETESYK